MSETVQSVQSLVEAHHRGDPDALDKLLDAYRGDLWGYLVNHVRNRADAEDIYQEVQFKVLKHVGTLKEPDRFRSWLFSIAMNAVRGFFRKKQSVSLDDELQGSLGPRLEHPAPSAQAAMEREEDLQKLRRCIGQLPERDREVLLLDAMAELPQKEIAEHLGLNLNTVKTINRRARIKLARLMTEVSHA